MKLRLVNPQNTQQVQMQGEVNPSPSAPLIYDVVALPETTEADSTVIYRLLKGTFVQNKIKYNDWNCHVVYNAGSITATEISTDNPINLYYVIEDAAIYGFKDDELQPIGNLELSDKFGDIIYSIANSDSDTVDLLLEYDIYIYKEGAWILLSDHNLQAEGNHSTKFNTALNEANGSFSSAFGKGTKATNEAEVAIGEYNKFEEDAIFSIGNGSDDTNRSNAFVVLKDGTIINKDIENKVDKITDSNKIYSTNSKGEFQARSVTSQPTSSAIAQYSSNETLKTSTPTQPTDCANKEYVDKIDQKIQDLDVSHLSDRIDDLEGLLIKYTEVNSDAYEVRVPAKSARKALVSYVGGFSQNSSVPLYRDVISTVIDEGVTLSKTYVLEAGSYRCTVNLISGEASQGQWFFVGSGQNIVAEFGAYAYVDIPVDNEYCFEIPNNREQVETTYEFVIEKTNVLIHAPTTKIISRGTNYLNVEQLVGSACRKNADGSYTLEKTSENDRLTAKASVSIPAGIRIVLRVIVKDYKLEYDHFLMQLRGKSGAYYSINTNVYGSYSSSIITAEEIVEAYAYIQQGASKDGNYITFTNVELTRVATYEDRPYFYEEYEMPQEILDLPGYGKGTDSSRYNYVHFTDKQYVKTCKEQIIVPEDVAVGSSKYKNVAFFKIPKPTDAVVAGITSRKDGFLLEGYTTEWKGSPWDDAKHVGCILSNASADYFWIGMPGGTTLQEAQNKLAGKTLLYYCQKNAHEYFDITDYLDYERYNFIEVQNEGTIYFENTYRLPVSSKITFAEV